MAPCDSNMNFSLDVTCVPRVAPAEADSIIGARQPKVIEKPLSNEVLRGDQEVATGKRQRAVNVRAVARAH